ncbi:hypothetical protein [Galactobacter valiniphilus]|uniref:hypothetical protein n=1 Tax=Galactobacter valiniphilus TaxID=2676122 RepID=UPI0013150189|nr:hypothetical protein [Galactobacter valiniphilus]
MTFPYAMGQLARALATAEHHPDLATRERAALRSEGWFKHLQRSALGLIRTGDRAPLARTPVWVTPDVLRGGFVSGDAAAQLPLDERELAVLSEASLPATRSAMNGWWLSESGMQVLVRLLGTGHYRLEHPEEGAFLAVAALLEDGDADAAWAILRELGPWMDRLRFSPREARDAQPLTGQTQRYTAAQTAQRLAHKRPQAQVEAQREAHGVWAPWEDRLVAFFEAWRNMPAEEVRASAAVLVAEYERLALLHTLSRKHLRPGSTLARLNAAVASLASAGELTPREHGLLDATLRRAADKRGALGSPEREALRARQRADVRAPSHAAVAAVVATRVSAAPPDRGLPDGHGLDGPLTGKEQERTGLPEGTPVPEAARSILGQGLRAGVDELLARGVVPSAEALAELAPDLVAEHLARTHPDPALGRLLALIYLTFRKRRTLLLLNLQAQVRFEELPWVGPLSPEGEPGSRPSHTPSGAGRAGTATAGPGQASALAVARRLGGLGVQWFPGTLQPNPLTSELRYLLGLAGSQVVLPEELAADIFMGSFSPRFEQAAARGARALGGSLYGRYYRLDYLAAERHKLAALCTRRARELGNLTADANGTAANGAVIEQAQVLSTHHLLPLLELGALEGMDFAGIARRALSTARAALRLALEQDRPLGRIKDAAYAWRNMVFFLAQLSDREAHAWVRLAAEAEGGRPEERVLAGLLRELDLVAQGGVGAQGVRAFYGWSTVPHPQLARLRKAAGVQPR